VIDGKEDSRRVILALLGAGAQALWYAAMAGPWAAGVAIGLLWRGTSWLWIVVIAGGVFLLFAWVAAPTQTLDGRHVTAGEAPLLFDTIERLRDSLNAAPIQSVLLTDELNAAAHQTGPFGLPWPMRQTLILGVPLLSVLRPQEAAAVIAHELGHFSRRHGVFGHWVYRTRLMWLELAHSGHADDSPFDRAVQWFASNFAPWFGRRSFALSRQCEYEADRDAAQTGAARDLVQALQNIDVAARRMAQWPRRPEFQALRHLPDAPADRWTSMLDGVSHAALQPAEVNAARSRAATVDDTHPSLAERAAALNVAWACLQDRLPARNESAGSVWLGSRWANELSLMNAAWQRLHRSAWRADCIHLQRLVRRLDSLARSKAHWTQRIGLVHALDRGGEVLRLAREANEPDESLPLGPAFLALRAKLEAGDAHAVPALQALISRDTAIAFAAREALLTHATARADAPQIEKNRALLDRAYRRRVQASAVVHQVIESAGLRASRLQREALDAFDEQCAADPPLTRAWLGSCAVSISEGHAFSAEVLVIQIDPDAMRSAGDDEDGMRLRYLRQLQRWMEGPQILSVVRVCFTTEAGLPVILDRSAARQWRRAQ
jgi:Zn-dependent protease with chaperone function